jgi:hypothetical protein
LKAKEQHNIFALLPLPLLCRFPGRVEGEDGHYEPAADFLSYPVVKAGCIMAQRLVRGQSNLLLVMPKINCM